MPDAATLPVKARVMPREEANFLAATQREFVRQQAEEAAMYRANPLLYVYNPSVKVGRGDEGWAGYIHRRIKVESLERRSTNGGLSFFVIQRPFEGYFFFW